MYRCMFLLKLRDQTRIISKIGYIILCTIKLNIFSLHHIEMQCQQIIEPIRQYSKTNSSV